MKLRTLIGGHSGEIRDYSPLAARGALASGLAELVRERVVETRPTALAAVTVMERPQAEPHKVTPSRRKG